MLEHVIVLVRDTMRPTPEGSCTKLAREADRVAPRRQEAHEIDRFSRSLIEQTIGRTELELEGFFDPVERQLHLLRRSIGTESLDAGDPAPLYLRIEAIMSEVPWIAGCMLADERGRGRLVRRTEEGWAAAAYSDDSWDDRVIGFGPGVEEQEPAEGRRQGFDARTRPWYLGATEKLESAVPDSDSRLHWTEPGSRATPAPCGGRSSRTTSRRIAGC